MKNNYDIFWKKAFWCENFAWLPKRSAISGKMIWMKFAYEGIAYYGPPNLEEIRWVTNEEYIFGILKGDLIK